MTNLVVSEYPGHGEPFGIVPHQTPTRLNVPHKQNDSVMAAGNYKDSIKDASQALVKANEIIFDSLINVETQGDLKEWNSTVPEREIHQFDFEIFRNSGDLNVQLLVNSWKISVKRIRFF